MTSMKFALVLVLAAAAVGQAANIQPSEKDVDNREAYFGHTAFINEYIDNSIPMIVNFIETHGLDPMELPDIEEGIEFSPVIITYSAKVQLTKGVLKNLVSVRRAGDASVSYLAKLLRVRMELAFSDLEFEYDYATKVMGLGPRGGCYGSLNNLNVYIDVLIDFNNNEIHLQSFDLTDIGRLRVRITGNILYDWLVNPLMGLFMAIFDNTIMGVVERNIRTEIINGIESINANIQEVIGNL